MRNKKSKIPLDLKKEFVSNNIRIVDSEYLENFFRNHDANLLKQYEKINKKDKNEYNKLIKEKTNLIAKNINQIDEEQYQQFCKKEEFESDDLYYEKKR